MKKYPEILVVILFLPFYISLTIPIIVYTIQVFIFYPIICISSKNKNKPNPLKDSIDFAKNIYKI